MTVGVKLWTSLCWAGEPGNRSRAGMLREEGEGAVQTGTAMVAVVRYCTLPAGRALGC